MAVFKKPALSKAFVEVFQKPNKFEYDNNDSMITNEILVKLSKKIMKINELLVNSTKDL